MSVSSGVSGKKRLGKKEGTGEVSWLGEGLRFPWREKRRTDRLKCLILKRASSRRKKSFDKSFKKKSKGML